MNIRPFEIALIGVFALIAVIGLIVLSAYQGRPSGDELLYGDRVVIWGTLPQETMEGFLVEAADATKALEVVSYREVDESRFENEFVNAVAEGQSPDLLIIPHTMLVSLRTKLTPLSYETITERNFRDSYVDGAEIFMLKDGIYGIPFAVDPLMMYWNRDIFSSVGLPQPPRTWETLVAETVDLVTNSDAQGRLTQSAVSLGGVSNTQNMKAILSALLLQTGNTIVEERGSGYEVTLGVSGTSGLSSGFAALSFYTQFAMPGRSTYSWNTMRDLDQSEFVQGKLGLYFGLGSEWRSIEAKNPNINYDVARIPQGEGATTLRTYGDFYAFAIPRASGRAQGAYAVSLLLSTPEYAKVLADAFDFAPVHRSLFGTTGNPFKEVIYQSALISRGWLDPSPEQSAKVFGGMVEEVLSGDTRQQGIVLDAVYKLEEVF